MQRFLNILFFSFLLITAGKSVENYTISKSLDLDQNSSFYQIPQKLPINSNALKENTLMNSEEENDFKEIVFSCAPQAFATYTYQNINFSFELNEVFVVDIILFVTDNSPPRLA